MNDDTVLKAEKLANSLIDTKLQEENTKEKIIDPLSHLRDTTAIFINKRFEKIQKDIELEEIAVEALKLKIQDGDVNFHDLANFLNQMRDRSTEATDSLLSFFKPTQGENSPLLPAPNENNLEGQIFHDASSGDLKVLNKLIQILKNDTP